MKYVSSVILGSILLGFWPISIKNIRLKGMPSESIVFYRFLFTLIICLITILITKKSFRCSIKQFFEISVIAILGLGTTTLFIALSLDYISAGMSNMIHFTYPAFVMLVMIIVFKEKINFYKVLSIALSLLGILILSQVKTSGSIKGIILASATTLTYGIYIIANKRASFSNLDTTVVIFYSSLALTIFFFLHASITDTLQIPKGSYVQYNIIVMALSTTLALWLIIYGVRGLGSTTASALNMFEPTTTVIAGIFIHKEVFTLNILVGSSLVILSTFIIILEKIRLKKMEIETNV